MYKNILVPISLDADRNAAKALDVAQSLCETEGTITALHVIEHMPDYSNDLLPENHLEITKAKIEHKLTPLVAKVPGAGIQIVAGHSARTILDFSMSHDVDCIIVASHRPGLQDYLLGSTAARVVRHATCAVHVVR